MAVAPRHCHRVLENAVANRGIVDNGATPRLDCTRSNHQKREAEAMWGLRWSFRQYVPRNPMKALALT
jgi:hypothetical protein